MDGMIFVGLCMHVLHICYVDVFFGGGGGGFPCVLSLPSFCELCMYMCEYVYVWLAGEWEHSQVHRLEASKRRCRTVFVGVRFRLF